MNIKGLGLGVALIALLGIAGFMYRSVVEAPKGPIACQADARVCPDGTTLGREGPACEFSACPFPNIELRDIGLAFALPAGYASTTPDDTDTVAVYVKLEPSGIESRISIRSFTYSEMTAADFVRSNAVLSATGEPAPPTAFTSVTLGPPHNQNRFSLVELERFEGQVRTTYYLAREQEQLVFRFDAESRNVANWTDPSLDVSTLPANQALKALLATLQGV